jgi:hypothetical protein
MDPEKGGHPGQGWCHGPQRRRRGLRLPGPHPGFRELRTPFSADESRELAAALAGDDHARVVALLERHATLDYPENKGFDKYSDQFGFHFDHIDSAHIDWI